MSSHPERLDQGYDQDGGYRNNHAARSIPHREPRKFDFPASAFLRYPGRRRKSKQFVQDRRMSGTAAFDSIRQKVKSLRRNHRYKNIFSILMRGRPTPVRNDGGVRGLQSAFDAAALQAQFDADEAIIMREMAALKYDQEFRTELLGERVAIERAILESPQRLAQARHKEKIVDKFWQEAELRLKAKQERRRRRKEQILQQHQQDEAVCSQESNNVDNFQKEVRAEVKHTEPVEPAGWWGCLGRKRKIQKEMGLAAQEAMAQMHESLWETAEQEEVVREGVEEKEREEREIATQRQEEPRKREEEERQHAEQRQAEAVGQATEEQQFLTIQEQLALYDAKWAALRSPGNLPPITYFQFPWPVLFHDRSLTQTPQERIRDFVFHPLRSSPEGMSPIMRLKKEYRRWHSDRFDAEILHLVAENHRELVKRDAGEVAKILSILKDEINNA